MARTRARIVIGIVAPSMAWLGVKLLIPGTGLTKVSVYEVETMGLAVVVAVMVTLGFAGIALGGV